MAAATTPNITNKPYQYKEKVKLPIVNEKITGSITEPLLVSPASKNQNLPQNKYIIHHTSIKTISII
jgi:hypothetical protein